ncbi:hypothetical protein [Paenibacillus elgii]|uniref:hypothetical protein n=1 Tax=Paenibacillus elgii TaxID=189691 RepID=UPI00203AF7DC|nr:hypothetical protein [Paenibacillus elgii]MCM3269014.1 hypothetical protein [Paenibacillus elgii]
MELIHQRQQVLYNNPQADFEHFTVVIDELLALSDVAKPIKEAFFSLLSQISLLGRTSKVHLLLVSQRFDRLLLPLASTHLKMNSIEYLKIGGNLYTSFFYNSLAFVMI